MQLLFRFGIPATLWSLACLAAVLCSGIIARRLVPLAHWADPPDGSVSPGAAARGLAAVLMAAGYATLDSANAVFFLGLAVGASLCFVCLLQRFLQLRRRYVRRVAGLWLPMGAESELYEQARTEFQAGRARRPGLSLAAFLEGFDASPHRSGALWPREVLLRTSRRLHTAMVLVIVSGAGASCLAVLLARVLAVFL